MIKNTNLQYGTISKLLHWLVVVFLFFSIPIGLLIARMDDSPIEIFLVNLHKYFGVTILILVVFRTIWKLANANVHPATLLSPKIIKFEKTLLIAITVIIGMLLPAIIYIIINLSKDTFSGWVIPLTTDIAFSIGVLSLLNSRIIYYFFYMLLLIIPISGWIFSSAMGSSVSFFGLFLLPALVDKNKALAQTAAQTHKILAYILIMLIAVHIFSAFYHHFILKDRILRKMWFDKSKT